MDKETIEKFELAYHYWIDDKIDDGDFTTLVYNFLNETKHLTKQLGLTEIELKHKATLLESCEKSLIYIQEQIALKK